MIRILRQSIALLISLSLLPVPTASLRAADSTQASVDALASLDKITIAEDEVRIQLSHPAKFNSFTTANPPRIVLEILGGSVSLTNRVMAGKGANLKRVRAGQFQSEPDPIARVVMDLKKMAPFTVVTEANALVVKIEGAAPAQAAAATPAPAVAQPVQSAAVPAPAKPQPAATAAMPVADKTAPAPKTAVNEKVARLQEKPVAVKDLNGIAGENSVVAPASENAPPAIAPSTSADAPALLSEPPSRDILGSLSKEKISLDLQDTDIGDVLKLLGAKANINVVYGNDVLGTVSLHLNDVPFNEAFSIVLSMKSLMMFQVGENTVRVITAKQLQKERQDTVGLTRVIPIGFSDAADIKRQVDAVRSQEKRLGTTTIDSKDNAIIVTDTPEGLASAERLIRALDARPKQVLIETKLVEVNLSKDLELGIQWGYFSEENNKLAGQTGTNFIGGNPSGFQSNPFKLPLDQNIVTVPQPPIGAAGAGTGVSLAADKSFGAFSFGRLTSNYLLTATLTAAAAKGKVKILSDPKVTTLNNKAATVNITTALPYATTNIAATGAATTTINNITVGVQLTVTPTINADGRISLHVSPNISKPSAQLASGGAATAGAISTDNRTVDTNIMVRDGETIVIGGLITDSITDTTAGIPFFQDIPLIGWLFKKKTQIRQRVELLIFVTTKILQD